MNIQYEYFFYHGHQSKILTLQWLGSALKPRSFCNLNATSKENFFRHSTARGVIKHYTVLPQGRKIKQKAQHFYKVSAFGRTHSARQWSSEASGTIIKLSHYQLVTKCLKDRSVCRAQHQPLPLTARASVVAARRPTSRGESPRRWTMSALRPCHLRLVCSAPNEQAWSGLKRSCK